MTAAAETTPPLFEVGRLIATAGVAEILSQMCESQYALLPALSRHVNGDWGNVSPQDKETNDAAVTNGSTSARSRFGFTPKATATARPSSCRMNIR